MYPNPLKQLIGQGIAQLDERLAAGMPHSASAIIGWMRQLAPDGQRAAYFTHPLAFPALLLPWWVNASLFGSPADPMLADVTRSTISGYYAIRLIDNVMDGEATVEPGLLPALNFFHSQFQAAYQPYFAAEHPFWVQFEQFWLGSADVSLREGQLTALDEAQFWQLSAQKVSAAKIPVAAICHRHGQPAAFTPWAALIDRLGGWHQLHNDLFDWQRDTQRGGITWFLSEAARRKRPAEPLAGWVAREGFFWGIDTLSQWMAQLQVQAAALGSPPLADWLRQRDTLLADAVAQVTPGLALIARLSAVEDEG
ncbi:MAG: hypothetical protein Kow0031_26970 [Anaerolineae bacterium]